MGFLPTMISLILVLSSTISLSYAYIDDPKTNCENKKQCSLGLLCELKQCVVPADYPCKPNKTPCKSGTICIGTSDVKLCKMPMVIGQQCDLEPYWVCASDLSCRSNLCHRILEVGQKGPCSDSSSHVVCADGLTCLPDGTNNDNDKCVAVVQTPGLYCDEELSIICKDGLLCEGEDQKKCLIDEDENCNDFRNFCNSELICVGDDQSGRQCKKPIELGETCGTSPLEVCKSELVCDGTDDKCKIPEHGICTEDEHKQPCVAGTNCVGVEDLKRCKKPITLGNLCDNPFKICDTKLVCDGDKCKIPEDGNCNAPGSICVSETACVGNDNQKKCKPLIPNGEFCDISDPLSVCEGGNKAVCEGGICKTKKNKSCSEYGNPVCVDGTNCVGEEGNSKCKEPAGPGQTCGSPLLVCEDDLICQEDRCKIEEDDKCARAPNHCSTGLICAGIADERQCKRPVPLGDSCGAHLPFAVCDKEPGLICDEEASECKVDLKEKCTSNSDCVTGAHCVGPTGNKQCRNPASAGEKCETDPYQICGNWLLCEDKKCKIEEDQECDARPTDHKYCQEGTSCVGRPNGKLCKAPVNHGEECDNVLEICNPILRCEQDICKVPVDGDCGIANSECVHGSRCVGIDYTKRCKLPIKVGNPCVNDALSFCEDGLICENICRLPEGAPCNNYPDACITGTKCVGPYGAKKCSAPVPVNKPCENTEECETDQKLVCDNKLCKVELLENCEIGQCKEGTRCVTVGSLKKCARRIAGGEACRENIQLGVCDIGYMCLKGKCVNLSELPEWAPCHYPTSKCGEKLVCVGFRTKFCVKGVREGEPCKTNSPFLTCEEGLKCTTTIPGGYAGYCIKVQDVLE